MTSLLRAGRRPVPYPWRAGLRRLLAASSRHCNRRPAPSDHPLGRPPAWVALTVPVSAFFGCPRQSLA
eukprot:13106317-Alexandrium_andersonii.AAC.1